MIKCDYQDEVVTFTSTIYPIDAKGMVEKWLLQVKLDKMFFDVDTKIMVNKMLSDTKVVVNKTFGMMPYTKVAETKMNSRWKSRWCAP